MLISFFVESYAEERNYLPSERLEQSMVEKQPFAMSLRDLLLVLKLQTGNMAMRNDPDHVVLREACRFFRSCIASSLDRRFERQG